MKKTLLLVGALCVLGTTAFGATGSYTGEVLVGMQQGPGRSDVDNVNYVETTLGRGSVNIMEDLSFSYDVDRDMKYDKDWNKTSEGWDTGFGLGYDAGTVNMMGQEWNLTTGISYGYDTAENFTSDSDTPNAEDSETKRLTTVSANMSTTYYGFGTTLAAYVAYDDVEGTFASSYVLSNSKTLNDSWSTSGDVYLDLAGTKNDKAATGDDTFSNDLFEGSISGDNTFDVTIYQALTYTKEIAENLYFSSEFGIEFYSVQDSTGTHDMYVTPALEYQTALGVTPYINYTAYAPNVTDESRNELNVGVKYSTKF